MSSRLLSDAFLSLWWVSTSLLLISWRAFLHILILSFCIHDLVVSGVFIGQRDDHIWYYITERAKVFDALIFRGMDMLLHHITVSRFTNLHKLYNRVAYYFHISQEICFYRSCQAFLSYSSLLRFTFVDCTIFPLTTFTVTHLSRPRWRPMSWNVSFNILLLLLLITNIIIIIFFFTWYDKYSIISWQDGFQMTFCLVRNTIQYSAIHLLVSPWRVCQYQFTKM